MGLADVRREARSTIYSNPTRRAGQLPAGPSAGFGAKTVIGSAAQIGRETYDLPVDVGAASCAIRPSHRSKVPLRDVEDRR